MEPSASYRRVVDQDEDEYAAASQHNDKHSDSMLDDRMGRVRSVDARDRNEEKDIYLYEDPFETEPPIYKERVLGPLSTLTGPLQGQRSFEKPDLRSFVLYTLCCALIYPFLYVVTLLSNGKSLFVVRLLVGLGCTVVAFVTGIFLVNFAKRFIEASTWVTLLQQNNGDVRNNMTLRELSDISSDPTSFFAATRLLLVRQRLRRSGKGVRRRMWYIYLFFFAFMMSLVGGLSFVLGRIVDITTTTAFDYKTFEEVPVFGDVSPDDIEDFNEFSGPGTVIVNCVVPNGGTDASANPVESGNEDGNSDTGVDAQKRNLPRQVSTTTNFQQPSPTGTFHSNPSSTTFTFNASYTPSVFPRTSRDRGSDILPPAWKYQLPSHVAVPSQNGTVYFTEPYHAQLRSDGLAMGSVNFTAKGGLLAPPETMTSSTESVDVLQPFAVRYPQWGVRVVCEKLPNLPTNLVTDGNRSVIYLPRDFVSSMHDKLDLDFDENTFRLAANNSVYGLDLHLCPDDGAPKPEDAPPGTVKTIYFEVGFSYQTSGRDNIMYLIDNGTSGDGWTFMEVFYFRLDTTEASQNATFSDVRPHSIPEFYQANHWLGYEIPVCLFRVDPWIIEIENSTRSADLARNLGRAATVDDPSVHQGKLSGGSSIDTGSTTRKLNSTGKDGVYVGAYFSSVNTWTSEAGSMQHMKQLDSSWTDGTGYLNYTTFNISLYETFRGVNMAKTILPFLAGSQQIVARRYKGAQVAFAHILTIPMIIAITALVLAGAVGCFFVPALPGGHPQRRFDLYSWVAALEGDGLSMVRVRRGDGSKLDSEAPVEDRGDSRGDGWRPAMPLEIVERDFGELRLRMPSNNVQ